MESPSSMSNQFGTLRDAITSVFYVIAKLCLLAIVGSYLLEIVARYFFSKPQWWVEETVSYLLLASVMMSMPKITQDKAHVALSAVLEYLGERARDRWVVALNLVSGIICLLITVLSLVENHRQFVDGILLIKVGSIQKVFISIWITYGFLWSALYFFRDAYAGLHTALRCRQEVL